MSVTSYCYIDSPIGRLMLAGDRDALTVIDFQAGPRPRTPDRAWVEAPATFEAAIAWPCRRT